MIVEKMLELVNQKSTLCIGGRGVPSGKCAVWRGKYRKKPTQVLYLNRQKLKEKKSINFSNCREKKKIPGMLLSFENWLHKLVTYTVFKIVYLLHASKSWGIEVSYYTFAKIESNWTIYRLKMLKLEKMYPSPGYNSTSTA